MVYTIVKKNKTKPMQYSYCKITVWANAAQKLHKCKCWLKQELSRAIKKKNTVKINAEFRESKRK